jgi:hypothetical protein
MIWFGKHFSMQPSAQKNEPKTDGISLATTRRLKLRLTSRAKMMVKATWRRREIKLESPHERNRTHQTGGRAS